MAAVKSQKHLSLSFAIETKIYYSRAPTHAMNTCFRGLKNLVESLTNDKTKFSVGLVSILENCDFT